jgi:DNA-binding NarL/FixJ family response regulator
MSTTSMQPIFLIADDHNIVRNGLSILIKEIFTQTVVFHAGNFNEINDQLDRNKIDILILDISFPEGSSLSILAEIKERFPDIRILIFSSFDEEIYALRYLKAGADGYISKLSTTQQIEEALHSIIKNGKYTSNKIRDKIMDSFLLNTSDNPLENLSPREMEIATLLVKGFGNLEISNTLGLKATTVSTYKTRVFEKLELSNLSDLIQTFNLYNDTF